MRKHNIKQLLKKVKSINKDYVDMYIEEHLPNYAIHIYVKSKEESIWWNYSLSYMLANDGFCIYSDIYRGRPRTHRNTGKTIQCHEIITWVFHER